ncbi:MAG: tape measure protein [Anaerolineales bacterium]
MIEVAKLLVEIGADVDELQRGLGEGQSALMAFSSKMMKMGVGFTTVFTSSAALAGKSIFDLGAKFEQAEVAFTTMLGSAERATAFLKDLESFAARTPFQFTELQDASRRLLAFGFAAEQVLSILTDIGDAVAGLGLGADGVQRVTLAIGQMQAKSKASGQEMLQLTEAGIPAWKYLAQAMGVSTAEAMKLVERGLVPADKAIQAILSGARQDFGGLMAQQAETAAGQLSNLQDSLEALGRDLAEIVLPTVKNLIAEAQRGVEWFSGLSDETKETVVELVALAAIAGPVMMGLSMMASGAQVLAGALSTMKSIPVVLQGINTAFNSWNSYVSLTNALTTQFGSMAVTLGSVALIVGSVAAVWHTWNQEIAKTQSEGMAINTDSWAAAIGKVVQNGANADEVLRAYADGIDRVNAAHEKGGLVADLFVNRQEIVRNGLVTTIKALGDTAKSWEEYESAVQNAAQMAGYQVDEQGRVFTVIRSGAGITRKYIDDLGIMSRGSWEAAQAIKNSSEYMDGWARAANGAAQAATAFEAASVPVTDIMNGLSAALRDAGMNSDATTETYNEIAVALGQISPLALQVREDMELLNQAFALGLIDKEAYIEYMQQAQSGMLNLGTETRNTMQGMVDQAVATREAGQAAADAAREYWGLAESLKGATQAQFAKEVLQQLGDLLKSDTPNVALYGAVYEDIAREFGFVDDKSMALAGSLSTLMQLMDSGRIAPEKMGEAVRAVFMDARDGIVDWDALLQKFGETGATIDPATQSINGMVVSVNGVGESAVTTGEALAAQMPAWVKTAEETAKKIQEAFTKPNWQSVGTAIADGIALGLSRGASAIEAAAHQAANAAYLAALDALEIHSPSRKGVFIGEMFVKGQVEGLKTTAQQSMPDASAYASNRMILGAQSAVSATPVVTGGLQIANIQMQFRDTDLTPESLRRALGALEWMYG